MRCRTKNDITCASIIQSLGLFSSTRKYLAIVSAKMGKSLSKNILLEWRGCVKRSLIRPWRNTIWDGSWEFFMMIRKLTHFSTPKELITFSRTYFPPRRKKSSSTSTNFHQTRNFLKDREKEPSFKMSRKWIWFQVGFSSLINTTTVWDFRKIQWGRRKMSSMVTLQWHTWYIWLQGRDIRPYKSIWSPKQRDSLR